MFTATFPMTSLNGRGQSALNVAVPFLQSKQKSRRLDTRLSAPLRQGQISALIFVAFIFLGIARLLRWGGPSHVARLVIAVVVDAVNRMVRRWLASHVLKERHELVAPSFTDGDASSTVAGEVLIVGVVAPRSHSIPLGIFWALAHPVRSVRSRCAFAHKASAGLRLLVAQRASFSVSGIAAIALAAPVNHAIESTRKPKNDPSAEALSRNVYHSHTSIIGLKYAR